MDAEHEIDRIARRMTIGAPPALRERVIERLEPTVGTSSSWGLAAATAMLVLGAGVTYAWLTRHPSPPVATAHRVGEVARQAPSLLTPSGAIPSPEVLSPPAAAPLAPAHLVLPDSLVATGGIPLPPLRPVVPLAIPAIQPAPLATPLIELKVVEIAPLVIGPLRLDAGG